MATEARLGTSFMKYGTVTSLLVVLVAYWYRPPLQGSELDGRLDAVLSSLLRAESKVGVNDVARPKVAIGKYFVTTLFGLPGTTVFSVARYFLRAL